jgi:hypothetical protein
MYQFCLKMAFILHQIQHFWYFGNVMTIFSGFFLWPSHTNIGGRKVIAYLPYGSLWSVDNLRGTVWNQIVVLQPLLASGLARARFVLSVPTLGRLTVVCAGICRSTWLQDCGCRSQRRRDWPLISRVEPTARPIIPPSDCHLLIHGPPPPPHQIGWTPRLRRIASCQCHCSKLIKFSFGLQPAIKLALTEIGFVLTA